VPVKIAIVEDNTFLRKGLKELLEIQDGFEVVLELDSCRFLIDELKKTLPDVVIMDIDLPEINGIEGVKLVKKDFSDIKILMFTVFDDDERIFHSIMAGASGYLLKKSSPLSIVDALREVMNDGAPMTPSIAARVLTMFKQDREGKINGHFDLTPREQEILGALVKGNSYKTIAANFFISIDTVRTHIRKIYEKLHVHSKSEAVAKALSNRLYKN